MADNHLNIRRFATRVVTGLCLSCAATAQAQDRDEDAAPEAHRAVRAKVGVMEYDLSAADLEITLLKESMAKQGKRIEALEHDTQYRNFAVGLNLQLGRSGSIPGLSARAGFLKAEYFVDSGGMIMFAPVVHLTNHVAWQPIGIGAILYSNPHRAFSAPWLTRSIDIPVQTGFSFRIWKGITAGIYATWYLPNPIDATRKTRDEARRAYNQFKEDLKTVRKARAEWHDVVDSFNEKAGETDDLGLDNDSTRKEIEDAATERLRQIAKEILGDAEKTDALGQLADIEIRNKIEALSKDVGRAYTDALKEVHIELTLTWTFE
jgi:hypothetical protein